MNTLSKNNSPLLVGLTGGIGSGKSTVAKIFAALGLPIFNSDEEAKNIVNTDENVKEQITTLFGNVYENGVLNRAKLASKVFKDKEALNQLNAIIHPAVAKQFDLWVQENINQPILIKEAAILVESGAYKALNRIVMVAADEDIRIARVMKRNNITESEVRVRMQNQLTDKERVSYCDYIINNNDELLMPQAINVIEKLKSQSL